MYEKIIENEFNQIWKQVDDLLPRALKRISAAEVVKTEGLANLDKFFNEHRKDVKKLLDDSLKKIKPDQLEYLEKLYDQIIELAGNCIPEKGEYNCKQKVKYREIIILFIACFKKWNIT